MTLLLPGRTRAWYLYDVANSGFVTVAITALGGPYVTSLAEAGAVNGEVDVLGLQLASGSIWAYTTSASVLLQVLFLPLLGAMADAPRSKHQLLKVSTIIGAVAALLFALVPSPAVLTAAFLMIVANVAFGAAIVAYNAFLADVAEPEDRDRVSARAYAWGYVGGGVLLAASLLLVTVEPFGLGKLDLVRASLVGCALWWGVLGLLAASRLRPPAGVEVQDTVKERLKLTVKELKATVHMLRRDIPDAGKFLVSFLCFNDAIQAVVALSAVYLTQELYVAQGREAEDATAFLLQLILLIQFLAIGGALLFAKLAGRIGTKRALMATLIGWVGAILYAAVLLNDQTDAWILGVVIALVLGGSQALARSQYSRLVPRQRQSAAFGLYELAERGTAWIGPLVFAIALETTGSYRTAIGMLVVLLGVGALLLLTVDTQKGEAAARDLESELDEPLEVT